MAYGDRLAVGVVFGKHDGQNEKHDTRPVFNKLDLPRHNLNILLPAIETDWPDNATLTQTLVFLVGEPSDVARRAEELVDSIPPPRISEKSREN